jgi:hypothetical protein
MLVGEKVLPERFSDDFTRLLRRYQVCRVQGHCIRLLMMTSLRQGRWDHT